MATMTYQQWLAARSRRAGRPVMSTPTEAAAFKNWQRQQPEYQQAVAAPQPALAAPVVEPPNPDTTSQVVDPADLWNAILKDPGALMEAASATQDYTLGTGTAAANWQTARNNLAAQLPQFQHEYDTGLRSAASRNAARGVAQSGQEQLERQEAGTTLANQIAENQRAAQAADNALQTEVTQAAQGFNNRYFGAFRDAATRYRTDQLGDFNNTYGINSGAGAPPTPPPVAPTVDTRPAQMTYKDFLAKHPGQQSNSTLAKKWDKRFNYGRRFA